MRCPASVPAPEMPRVLARHGADIRFRLASERLSMTTSSDSVNGPGMEYRPLSADDPISMSISPCVQGRVEPQMNTDKDCFSSVFIRVYLWLKYSSLCIIFYYQSWPGLASSSASAIRVEFGERMRCAGSGPRLSRLLQHQLRFKSATPVSCVARCAGWARRMSICPNFRLRSGPPPDGPPYYHENTAIP